MKGEKWERPQRNQVRVEDQENNRCLIGRVVSRLRF